MKIEFDSEYWLLFMVIMLLTAILPSTSFSQNVPNYLNPNEFIINYSLTEVIRNGQIEYGLPNKLGIRLGGKISKLPYYAFTFGLYRIDKFMGNVDYWGNADFSISRWLFYYKNVIIKSNATSLTPTTGLISKIPIGKHVAFIPFSGIL